MRSDGKRPSWRRVTARPGIWCLLFGLAMVFFNWPLLGAYSNSPLLRSYAILFVVWAVFVVGLFALCRAARRTPPKGGEPE